MWTACPAPPRPAPLTSPGNRCPQARTIVSAAPFRYQQRLENQTAICGSFANLPYPDFVPPYIELFGNASNPDTPTDDIIGKFRGAIKAAIDTVHALKGAKEFPRASVILAKHLRDIHEGINLANATKDQIIAAIKLCGRKYQALGEIVQRGGKEVLAAALKDCNAAIDAENAAAAARFKALRGDVENPILLFTKRMNEKKFNIKTVTSEQLRDIFGEIINMFAKSATDVVDKHKDLFKYVFLYMTPAIIDEIVKIYKTGEWTDFIGDLADGTSEEEKVTENALEKRQTEIFARLLEEFGGGDGGGGGGGGGGGTWAVMPSGRGGGDRIAAQVVAMGSGLGETAAAAAAGGAFSDSDAAAAVRPRATDAAWREAAAEGARQEKARSDASRDPSFDAYGPPPPRPPPAVARAKAHDKSVLRKLIEERRGVLRRTYERLFHDYLSNMYIPLGVTRDMKLESQTSMTQPSVAVIVTGTLSLPCNIYNTDTDDGHVRPGDRLYTELPMHGGGVGDDDYIGRSDGVTRQVAGAPARKKMRLVPSTGPPDPSRMRLRRFRHVAEAMAFRLSHLYTQEILGFPMLQFFIGSKDERENWRKGSAPNAVLVSVVVSRWYTA